ncbi:MAG TPA: dihydrodipicolinate reductase C-terminal domain-containing protein [Chitinophagaceae bacterium]|nr:dihydrodipicolinate reductase C-terminal domain-containing protein [Chitinophagaceae bacterium]
MKLAIIGYGKMGRAIESVALQRGHQIVLTIHSRNGSEMDGPQLRNADVAIEVSTPQSAADNILKCFEAGLPVVCGTTGWLDRLAEIHMACLRRGSAFLYASNFSIGVNILFGINRQLAACMAGQQQYRVRVEETHHMQKKDAPSGTAITLADQVLSEVPRLGQWVNHESDDAATISILSHRLDQEPGTHRVIWSSLTDDLEISHTAHSRNGFAEGAIEAAGWIAGKTGIFSMEDVLSAKH